MQQVRAGVVAGGRPATTLVDLGAHRLADGQVASERPEVDDRIAHALRVGHLKASGRTDELAAVADLATALGVERSAVEHHRRRLAGHDREHAEVVGARLVRVADELAAQRRDLRAEVRTAPTPAARTLALLLHGGVEAGAVDRHAPLGGHLDGQVDREAEGVVQAEGIGAGDDAAGGDQLGQPSRAGLEGARELLLLGVDGGEDLVATLAQQRVRVAHEVDDDAARLAQERATDAQQAPVTHRAAHDPAQDVARALVRRRHALGQQERHRPRVIGDDLVAEALRLHRVRVMADERRQAFDDRHEQIGPVVRVDALDGATPSARAPCRCRRS